MTTIDYDAIVYAPVQPARFDQQLLPKKPDVGTRNKRRKGGKKLRVPDEKEKERKKDLAHAYETFDINVHDGEDGSEGEGEVKDMRKFPCQLRDFQGKQQTLVDHARYLFHIFLLNHNAFPSEEEVEDWSREAYRHAAIFVYKERHEGK